MKLVIVESPAKAKKINQYLGKDYHVMASFGHIRDVPAKNGSVRPEEDFAMDWEVGEREKKTVREMVSQVAKAECLYLASDPDREGEAIAWHVVQELKRRKELPEKLPVYRVVFHEITKSAILDAIAHPREIDMQLVDAYLARRALDYLVGFHLSPVLWRKLPGAKSAGRVQSVALRLICEREDEIIGFKPQEYWGINVDLNTIHLEQFTAKLNAIDGKKLDKFDLNNGALTQEVKQGVEKAKFQVGTLERKQVKRNPAPAFTTSTLQQEASRKLGFSAKKTMQVAQKLYESGFITYMRTDSVALAEEAITAIRQVITQEYGEKFLPEKPRVYKNNSKNAQEAHEAIRPTNALKLTSEIDVDTDGRKLYELIWKRTVACQMESALLDKVGIDIPSTDKKYTLRATGQTISFPGFIKVYKEDVDDEKEEDSTLLPPMNEGEDLETLKVNAEQHFTEPPPRFSEASLVKKLEELGIGRPSTYASILSVLQERDYVKLVNKRFVPEDRGRIVTAFLTNYFNRYVQYDYTANLENKLDDITNGVVKWKDVLTDFWALFNKTIQDVEPHKMGEVLETVAKTLEHNLFPTEESRVCTECKTGRLSLKVGKFGAFIGCSNYPKCKYTRQLAVVEASQMAENGQSAEQSTSDESKIFALGKDASGRDIAVKKGPYGWYVQQGTGEDVKRVSLPKNMDPMAVDITTALGYLSLPKMLGNDPNSNEPIEVGIGRFGPYVKRGQTFQSLTGEDNVLTVDLARALALLSNAKEKQKATVLGKWQDQEVTYQVGRYGPYVKCGKMMASAKKDGTIPTLDEAITLIQNKMREK